MWYSRHTARLLLVPGLLAGGCIVNDLASPERERDGAKVGAIQPGAGANAAGFFWLPPLVKDPGPFTGTFDGSRQPVVRVVCTGAAGLGCPEVIRHDGASPGAAKVTVDLAEEAYRSLWQTPATLEPGSGKYRLEVLEEGELLGEAPLRVVASQQEANGVPAGEIAVVLGHPVNIKFRIEVSGVVPPPVTVALGPAGGSADVPLEGGARLQVEVPEGALDELVQFTFTPLPPAADRMAGVGLTPGNVRFRGPVRLTLTVGRSLTAEEQAVTAVAIRTNGSPVPLILPSVPSGTSGRSFTAVTTIIGAPEAVSPSGTARFAAGAQASEHVENAAEIAAVIADAETRAASLRAAADELAARRDFESAIRVRIAAAALLQEAGDPENIAGKVLEEVKTAGCQLLEAEITVAPSALGTEFRNLRQAMRPALAWAGAVRGLGVDAGTCEADAELTATLSALVTQFIAVYASAMQRSTFRTDFPSLHDQLWEAVDLRTYGPELGLDAEFNQLRTTLQLPIARLLRRAAYQYCRTDQEHEFLGGLFQIAREGEIYPRLLAPVARVRRAVLPEDLPYTAAQVSDDIQFCGTRVTVETKASDGTSTGTAGPLGGGDEPDDVESVVDIRAPYQGRIELDGLLIVQQCPDGSFGNDVLDVTFNGQPVRTLERVAPTSQFIRGSPTVFTMADLLAAGMVPATDGGEFPLTVSRRSDGCGGAYLLPEEAGDRELLRIRVGIPKVSVSPTTATLAAGGVLTLTATVEHSDRGVTWEAEGGTGTGDEFGYTFTAGDQAGTFTITARSLDDPDRLASMTGTIEGSCPAPGGPAPTGMALSGASCASLSISPASTTMATGGSRRFLAILDGTDVPPQVTWTASRGTISGTGRFTAPLSAGPVTITATLVSDPTVQATAEISVESAFGFLLQVIPSLSALGHGQSRLFTVSGGTGPFTWAVDAGAGTIDASGRLVAGPTRGEYAVMVSSLTGRGLATVIVDPYQGVFEGVVTRNTVGTVRTWSVGRYSTPAGAPFTCQVDGWDCYFTSAIDFGAQTLEGCYFTVDPNDGAVAGFCDYSAKSGTLSLSGSIFAAGLSLIARHPDGDLTISFDMLKR